MLNTCRVSPGHEAQPWSTHTVVDSMDSLGGKTGITSKLYRVELLSGLCDLVMLFLACRTASHVCSTTSSLFESQWGLHH